jgi:hypothetical protein
MGLDLEPPFRFVEVRHGVDFIPVIQSVIGVEDDRFEGRRAVGNPIRCLEPFDETTAFGTLVPLRGQRFPPVPEIRRTDVP